LRELGYIENLNIHIEWRWGRGSTAHESLIGHLLFHGNVMR